jgi:hypothetical protein
VSKNQHTVYAVLICLMLYALGIYSYMTLRFLGNWSEVDTSIITRVIESSIQSASVLKPEVPYTNGMGYPSIIVFLTALTGLPTQILQFYVLPVVMAFIPVVIFIAYRSLINHKGIALLATLMVYLQPDFLWVTWRGSHEKVTWLLVLVLLFLLSRSFIENKRVGRVLRYMLAFYLCIFSLVTINVFFSSSFIFALIISFLGAFILFALRTRFQTDKQTNIMPQIRRVVYITFSCLICLYLFMFHIYPLVTSSLRLFGTLFEQLALILLPVEESPNEAFNAYSYLNVSWLNPLIFLILTLFNWLILGVSFVTWAHGIPRYLRQPNIKQHDLPRLFLWLLYPGFAVQLAFAVIADFVQLFSGNLQVRLFTPLMLIAIPIAAIGFFQFYSQISRRLWRNVFAAILIPIVMWFGIAALLKATNEPLLSNKWLFTTATEREAVDWSSTHLQDATVWLSYDERVLVNAEVMTVDDNLASVRFDAFIPEANTRYYLVSEMERLRLARWLAPELDLNTENIVYDNGSVQIFHRRPRTPFQR